jgi:hypothetical protein
VNFCAPSKIKPAGHYGSTAIAVYGKGPHTASASHNLALRQPAIEAVENAPEETH